MINLRKRHKENIVLSKYINEAVLKFNSREDPRPYAIVYVNREEIRGLLDSGASVSLLRMQRICG